MSMIDLGEDDGYVTIVTADGAEVRLDLFELSSRISDFHQANRGATAEVYNQGALDLLTGLGLPPMSLRMAARLFQKVQQMVEEVKRQDAPFAQSPGSTTSTPGS